MSFLKIIFNCVFIVAVFRCFVSAKMTTTKKQYEILSSYMESHPELAKSYNALSSSGRATQKHQWEQLARSLNSNGPPSKTVAEWKRIWTLRKYKTKKKLTENKNSLKQTGGGPFDLRPLDPTDEAIVAACGMEAAVTGIVGGLSFGTNIKENSYEVDEFQELINELTNSPPGGDYEGVLMDSSNTKSPKQKLDKGKKVDDVLKEQLELQKNYFAKHLEGQNKMNESLIQIKDAILKLAEAKEKENNLSYELKNEELKIRSKELEVAKLTNELKLLELNSKTD